MSERAEPGKATRPPPAAPRGESDDVVNGLKRVPRQIPARFLYDTRGSELFEEICRQPEYYPTRTELHILERHAAEIGAAIGSGALIVEPGIGAGEKTEILLRALESPAGYVPVDICDDQLERTSKRLAELFPSVPVTPVCGDFSKAFALPADLPVSARRVIFFPGSTIGNFTHGDAVSLLTRFRDIAGEGGALLVGVDLVKAPGILHRAYNDAAGVTAEFNVNVLHHLNRRFGANFDVAGFRHAAVWLPDDSRVEMQLWSQREQQVELAGATFFIRSGEKLVTEWSHKYTVGNFARLARQAGWVQRRVWMDGDRYFSVQYFEARATEEEPLQELE